METLIISFLFIIILILIFSIIFLYKKMDNNNLNKKDDKSFLLIQQQMQEITKTLDQKIGETNKAMNTTQNEIHKVLQEQFGQSTKTIQGITGESNKILSQITEKLTTLDKTNQQVIGFSEQLNNLEKTLKHQKQRGNLGEAGLQLVLENILPPGSFDLQHRFEDGDIVDALIKTKDGSIPVDAKFSLDNYERLINENNEKEKERLEKDFKNDLKKRIDETSKYIKTKEGTLEFAFMFIPSEAIYYDLLVNEVGAVKVNTRSLIDYAFKEKKVIIVSPTTFAAYLQTVLQGLRAFKIEEGTKTIKKNVEQLAKHLLAYEDYIKRLGVSLSTSVNTYNKAYHEFAKIDKDVVKINDGQKTVVPKVLENPKLELE